MQHKIIGNIKGCNVDNTWIDSHAGTEDAVPHQTGCHRNSGTIAVTVHQKMVHHRNLGAITVVELEKLIL